MGEGFRVSCSGRRLMGKAMWGCLATLCMLGFCGWSFAEGPGHSVAGDVTFEKTGNIYVKLVSKEDFEAERDGPHTFVATVGPEEIRKGRVAFVFRDIPAGTYGLCAFQDVDGTGKLETGLFGPKEPWGNYRPSRPSLRAPRFDEISFEVNGDKTGIAFGVK